MSNTSLEPSVLFIECVLFPLPLQRRFEDALKKLRADLDSRLAQRQQLSERKRAKDQARAQIEEDSINVGVGGGRRDGDGDGDGDGDEDGDVDAEDEEEEAEADTQQSSSIVPHLPDDSIVVDD